MYRIISTLSRDTLTTNANSTFLQCAGPENIHTPPQRKLKFRGGGGFCKTKTFKEICEALSEFPEGWREGS